MVVLDSPFQVGEEASFVGEIRCICGSAEQAEATVKYVLAGLRWVRQIGAERTVGFGRVQSVELSELTISELAPHSKSARADIPKCFDSLFAVTQSQRQVT